MSTYSIPITKIVNPTASRNTGLLNRTLFAIDLFYYLRHLAVGLAIASVWTYLAWPDPAHALPRGEQLERFGFFILLYLVAIFYPYARCAIQVKDRPEEDASPRDDSADLVTDNFFFAWIEIVFVTMRFFFRRIMPVVLPVFVAFVCCWFLAPLGLVRLYFNSRPSNQARPA